MKFSPTFINTLIISGVLFINVAGVFISMGSNAYEIENSANLNNAEVNSPNWDEVNLNDVSSGTLLFKQSNSKQFLQAPQLKTQVDIIINGIVANVKVKQKFTNASKQWQHGVYAFPLPDDSAINQLIMRVGERVIIGEIQEKKQARETFNKAKKNGRKAALVEQHRPNLFTTHIANIPPNETVEVELTYFQQVNFHKVDDQAGEFSLHFPMAITPRYQPNRMINSSSAEPSENSRSGQAYHIDDSFSDQALPDLAYQTKVANQTIDLSVNLFSGAVLDQVNSINHSLISTQKSTGHYALKLVEQPMNKDFKLTWQYQQQDLPQVLNFQQKYHDKHYGLLMVLPGALPESLANSKNKNKVKVPRELTFILDTSGSMAGSSLDQAKQAFKYALSSLTEHDSFQLIAFNSYPTQLFSAPVSANNKHKQQAWRFVSELQSTGGTEIKSALNLALKPKVSTYYKTKIQTQTNDTQGEELQNKYIDENKKLQQIVFLTDGAVGNEAEIFSELAKNIGNKRLFTVGLGSAPNRYFMKKAAEIGRGSYQFISNHSELVKEMNSLFSKLSQPVLTNLMLNVEHDHRNAKQGSVTINTTPNPIPDVYAGEPLFLSYQITGQKADSLLSGIYQGKAWSVIVKSPLDENVAVMPKPDFIADDDLQQVSLTEKNIPPLATLWARRKIADHFRQLMLYKEPEAKANIIELALEYHLITPFTSLVAVEKEVSRPPNQTAKTKQLTNTLPAGQKLPSTALNWQWQFNAAISLLIMSAISLLLLPSRKRG
ncbi:marine proteobacterial sortase target protein [Colwellia echini]|uniref:Marine proteobacterial sortase target protein n=1 Tax=Colwellia echini TaxID=1982103 RepID=A0ABY3MUB8_9GAMM|nr:marine proteobacterial sortase target protein [Colwellia echini]TYK64798.1 marine proteobacterial sortase target protein [Colwellia echini]